MFYIINDDTNTFTKLNETINGNTNSTIYLNGDYRYYEGIELEFIKGIVITRDIEIYANGITIDASKINRVFSIYNATVVLSGINFMNCDNGFGAIYADCADLTIINSNFENNQIIESFACGGAIANYNGNLTIINSNFTNNTATGPFVRGGAIYTSNGNLTIINSSFTNNQATGGEAYGGAVATYGTSNLTVSNSNFINNKVTGGLCGIGGAISADGCSAIINSNFKNNIVTGDFAGGGAIFVNEADLNITNSNFTNNQAYGNESGGMGGAVYAYAENNDLIITNSNFEFNKVTGKYADGGAVCGYAHVSITKSTFKNNQAVGTEGVSSGAVCTENSSTIINSTFENNKAIGEFEAWGGAIYTISELRIINSTFENNQVESPLGYGGAIYDNSILFVTNSNFTNNKVTGGEYGTGGAIGVSDNSQLEVDNSVFESNKAMNFKGKGNAISAGQYSTVTISNSTFIDNDVDANYDNSTNKYISSVAFEIEYIDDFLIGSSITIRVTETKNGNAFNGTVTVSIGDESYTLTIENGFGETTVTPSVVPGEYTVKLNFTGNEEYLPATCESNIFRIISEDDGTFTKLNRVINDNDDPKIYLSDDFEFYVSVDSAFIDGIEINRDVEIYGNGITIDASNVNRIFSIYNANVVFHDINFINCADGGGAIYAYAGTLKIINCNFTNNTATVPYLSGGAIYNDNGDLTIINSNFKNNQATRYSAGGGAVYNHGILTIIDSTFENNKANGENEGYGGAIYSYDGTVTITNSSFINNQATGKYGRGGAIYANKGTVTITNSSFINNQANGNYTYGGAVYNLADATVTIDGTLFKSNHADYGAAISTQDGDNWINLSNSTFVDNNVAARFDDDTNKFLTEVAFEIGNINDFIRGSSITIHVTETEKGNAFNGIVTVSIGDESYTIEIVNGTGTRVVSPNVTPGAYVAKLSFAETGEYYSATAESNLFKVIGSPEIRIENIDNFVNGNSITVRVTALQSFSGELNLTIDGVNYTIHVVNGSGEKTITPSLNLGTYTASINFIGNGYYFAQKVESNPFNVTATTQIITKAVTAVYNKNTYLVITLKDNQGNLLKGIGITVNFGTAKIYTTDENGQVKIPVGNLIPKTYNVRIDYEGDNFYKESSASVNVVVKKATPKLTAKSKTFKKAVKIKKYKITLKNNIGKVMKNIKVTLKVNKKTFTAKTNSKGQATFKIKKLSKKGTYKATITFKGNKYYNKVVKKVKIKIK